MVERPGHQLHPAEALPEGARLRVLEACQEKGHYFAKVEPVVRLSDDGTEEVGSGLMARKVRGAILIGIGAVQGGINPLRPLEPASARVELPFERIKSVADLDARIAQANTAGQSVMLDFYADWCVSCKEMEHYTFPRPAVREALADTLWLQADVTANDATDQALLQHLGVFAPPTIAFFGTDGAERRNYRVVGYMKAEEFAPLVQAALK